MTAQAAPIEKQSKQSKRGGARPNAGRKAGKLSAAKVELRELCKAHVPAMLKKLVDIANNGSSEAAQVSAIKEVMDRAYGKAPQAITGEGGEGPVQTHSVIEYRVVRSQG